MTSAFGTPFAVSATVPEAFSDLHSAPGVFRKLRTLTVFIATPP
jgi:hypothetical protein